MSESFWYGVLAGANLINMVYLFVCSAKNSKIQKLEKELKEFKILNKHFVRKGEAGSVCGLCGGVRVFNAETVYRYVCPLCDA